MEPSEFASAYARERLGLDVIRDDLFEADLGGRRFEAIVMGDVIEHLPRPADALDRMAEMLTPGGVAYLALPNAGSRLARRMGARWWSVIPTHVQYFTGRACSPAAAGAVGAVWVGTRRRVNVRYYLEGSAAYRRGGEGDRGSATAEGVADRSGPRLPRQDGTSPRRSLGSAPGGRAALGPGPRLHQGPKPDEVHLLRQARRRRTTARSIATAARRFRSSTLSRTTTALMIAPYGTSGGGELDPDAALE